jgi:hypothetical protein
MYDSTTARDIPTSATKVAGYVDGLYTWTAEDWARFPRAVHVRIAIFGSTNDGVVLDVEPGCASPGEAPGWTQRRRAAGVDPTVYVNLSTWPIVTSAFRGAGVTEPHYWIAHYDNVADNIPMGAVAKQYIDQPRSGGHYDKSVVADFWPGVDSGVIVTSLDDAKQSVYVDPAGKQSSTSMELWKFLLATDSSAWWVRQAMAGEQRVHMPDGAYRNMFDALVDLTARMMALDAKMNTLITEVSAEEAAILAAIKGVTAGVVDVTALANALTPLISKADIAALAAQLSK